MNVDLNSGLSDTIRTQFDEDSSAIPPSSSGCIVMDASQFVVSSNSIMLENNSSTGGIPSGEYVVQYVSEEVINSITSQTDGEKKDTPIVAKVDETSLSDAMMTDVINRG